MSDIQNPIFYEEDQARDWLETQVWPNGPTCPHCGSGDATRLAGKSHRPGLIQCNECRRQYTVTVGTLFERSKISLSKWLLVMYLMSSSKKGMSTNQISKMVGLPYKTAWFMTHRIREAMREGKNPLGGPLGGENKVVEADETYIGGKAKNVHNGAPIPHKEPVVALIERDGKVRSFHVEAVNQKNLRPILYKQIDRASYLMTDEANVYKRPGSQFAGHGSVNHSINEYVRGSFWHTNTVESYFAVLKRGINGNYQWVSAKHLKRYLGEFDFRYNSRDLTNMERTALAAKGIVGKRLTYRRTNAG